MRLQITIIHSVSQSKKKKNCSCEIAKSNTPGVSEIKSHKCAYNWSGTAPSGDGQYCWCSWE